MRCTTGLGMCCARRIARADLDATCIADEAVKAASVDEQFRAGTFGGRILHALVAGAFTAARGDEAARPKLRDQLLFHARCGFDAFAVRADKDINDALNAFDEFSERYQGATDNPEPLFRRRAALAAASGASR